MKKRNLVLAAALSVMTVSLTVCGRQRPVTTQPAVAAAAETRGGDQRGEPKEDQRSGETATVSAKETRHEKILESGAPKIGTKGIYRPSTCHSDGNGLCGYDVEVVRATGEETGIKIEFSETTWEGLLTSLDIGVADLILNQIGVIDEKKAKCDFSVSYLYSYVTLITKTDNNDVTDWGSANGEKTSLNISSNYTLIVEKRNMGTIASDTFSRDIELLLVGRIDCIINNTIALSDFLTQKPNTPIKVVTVLEQADAVAVPIPQGNDDFVEAINKAVAGLRADETLTEPSNRYLGKDFPKRLTLEEAQQ